MPSAIEDYALISDMESAALVARDGSIDWLTFPRFDSGACFAALLGTNDNGRWLVAPTNELRRVTRRYVGHSLVLETVFEVESGEVAVIDCMPPRDEHLDVVRIVEGRAGSVPMHTELVIRFDYGRDIPWVRRVDDALVAISGPDSLRLSTPVALSGIDHRTVGEFTVEAGQRVPFLLTLYPSHEIGHDAGDPLDAITRTTAWWDRWVSKSTYEGRWGDEVLRSLVVLKGLTHARTGGLVAAPTTSLPEQIGGQRNWDYRYCWLRDATFTLNALIVAGFTEEAIAWRDWLLRAVAGEPDDLQIMYGVAGERRLVEIEADWLPGYLNSRPVRLGNAATEQFQLDVFGEVLDSLHQAAEAGIAYSEDEWNLQLMLLEFLEANWTRPDEGIWEVRGPRRDFTHSKVMAWVAVDRAVRAVEELGWNGPVDRWRRLRDDIKRDVLTHGVDDDGRFVQHYGSTELDASLLIIPQVGFLPATDERVARTVDAIQEELTVDGFVRRYRTREDLDRLPPGEGTFLLATFWLADVLAMMGRTGEATEIFERLLTLRNDVGLLAEGYEPGAGRFLGNFPQAFSHTALVNTAAMLDAAGEAPDEP